MKLVKPKRLQILDKAKREEMTKALEQGAAAAIRTVYPEILVDDLEAFPYQAEVLVETPANDVGLWCRITARHKESGGNALIVASPSLNVCIDGFTMALYTLSGKRAKDDAEAARKGQPG